MKWLDIYIDDHTVIIIQESRLPEQPGKWWEKIHGTTRGSWIDQPNQFQGEMRSSSGFL